MANTTKTSGQKSRPAHSGFEGPTIGVAYPKGTKFKNNPDGTRTPIYPKTKPEKKK